MEKTPNKQTSPLLAIFVFISIIAILPFYESKRFSIWEAQERNQNIFTQTVLKYSLFSESFKAQVGLNKFFERDQEFWEKIKKSSIVFENPKIETQNSPLVIQPIEKTINDISEEIQKNVTPLPEKENVPEEKPVQEPKEEPFPEIGKIIDDITQKIEETNNDITKKEPPFRILIMGDSFMAVGGGLGDPLERSLLAYQGVSVNRFGRVSSGIATPNYFNWNTTAENLINQYNPNIAIVMFGANDDKTITSSAGKAIPYGYPGWNAEYAKKVGYFIDILERNNIIVFWIGLPIMRDQAFSNKMANLNSVYEAEVKNHTNSYFIPTWDSLADKNGNYTAYMKDETGKSRQIRLSDGVHLQYYAGYLISDEIILKMKELMVLEKTK